MPDISRPAAARRDENITDFVEKTLKRSRKKEKNHLLQYYNYPKGGSCHDQVHTRHNQRIQPESTC